MNKVFENFRDHPNLKHDSIQIVFKIEGKMYLITEGDVYHIIPRSVRRTNIGEPYANLVRLNFVFAHQTDTQYEDGIDFDPDYEAELLVLIA